MTPVFVLKLLVTDGPGLGERKPGEGTGMSDQQITDGIGALVGIEGHSCLGSDGGIQGAREFGCQGHATLGVDDTVVGTDQGDPEQCPGFWRRFPSGNGAPVRRLHVPAVRNVVPGDGIAEPISQDDDRRAGDDGELSFTGFYILDDELVNLGMEDRQLVAAGAVHILRSNRPVPPPALVGFTNPVDGYERTPDRRSRPSRALDVDPIESEVVRHLHRVMIPASGLLDVMQRVNPFGVKNQKSFLSLDFTTNDTDEALSSPGSQGRQAYSPWGEKTP
jgi:hypothetical protein